MICEYHMQVVVSEKKAPRCAVTLIWCIRILDGKEDPLAWGSFPKCCHERLSQFDKFSLCEHRSRLWSTEQPEDNSAPPRYFQRTKKQANVSRGEICRMPIYYRWCAMFIR